MADKIEQVISRYTEKGDGRSDEEVTHDDEMADVLNTYGSAHASERLARRRRAKSPKRAGLTRRPTSLTVLSDDAAMLAVQATLSEDERLVIADDGVSLEIATGVEEDEEVEGEVILRG